MRTAQIIIRVVDGETDCVVENNLAKLKESTHALVGLEEEEEEEGPTIINIVNKCDLLPVNLEYDDALAISCTEKTGVEAFFSALNKAVQTRVYDDGSNSNNINNSNNSNSNNAVEESALVTRSRHRIHLLEATKALEKFHELSKNDYNVDMAAEELRIAANEIGMIVGKVGVEDILDKLFKDFCIGK